MATVELSTAGLGDFDFDHRRYPYASSRVSWPMPMDQTPSRATPQPQRMANVKRSTSPLESHTQAYDPAIARHPHQHQLMPEWPISQPPLSPLGTYPLDTTFSQQYSDGYQIPFQTSPTEFLSTQSQLGTGLQMDDNPYLQLTNQLDGSLSFDWQDLQRGFPNDLLGFAASPGLQEMNMQQQNLSENSPTDTYLEVRSLTSSSSDNGWNSIECPQRPLDSSFQEQQMGAIFDPGSTLHSRSLSDSSFSDIEHPSRVSWGSGYVNVAPSSSPGTDSLEDVDFCNFPAETMDHVHDPEEDRDSSNSPPVVTSSLVQPIDIKPSSPQKSPVSSGRGSPPGRRQSKKNTNPKVNMKTIRRSPQAPKVETEKKVGRRKGPLRPEQRRQACEIRKLGACLRCRFLKKTVSTYRNASDGLLMESV